MTHQEESLNLVQIFYQRALHYDRRTALLTKDPKGNAYYPIAWNDWAKAVEETALGLAALGVKKGDRVGILSENRPEWTYADLGALSLGAVTVPFYVSSSYQDIAYMVGHTELEVLFVSNGPQWDRIRGLLNEGLKLRKIILFDSPDEGDSVVTHLDALRQKGRVWGCDYPGFWEKSFNGVRPDDWATIIYTSGTTGAPKGVVLTHHHFVANYLASKKPIPVSEKDIELSFLPLSHVFERLAGYYFLVFQGVQVAYAENMKTVPEDLLLVRPTIVTSVPRLYEKIYLRILETVEASSWLRRLIFSWAIRVGREYSRRKLAGKAIPGPLVFRYKLATYLVFRKLKQRLGGRLRFFISGGAPLPKALAEFFYMAGVLILEGYGLTETSPVIAVNAHDDFRFGTVGKPIACAKVKLAEDGEILTQGPCVMVGYYKNQGATDECMRDGWFHTGDIGCFDEDGFLKITDRKKDIIVTSGGKNISPQNLENRIMADRLFSQIVVIGDRRPYLVALIVPNEAEIKTYAQAAGLGHLPWRDLLSHPSICDWVQSRLQAQTRDFPRHEQIRYFSLLENELTQAGGEMTPTMKLKRRVIQEKYHVLIEGLYRRGEQYQREVGV